jgi:hypothetical protein
LPLPEVAAAAEAIDKLLPPAQVLLCLPVPLPVSLAHRRPAGDAERVLAGVAVRCIR